MPERDQDQSQQRAMLQTIPQTMTGAQIWGRRVMLAVLSLVPAIPVVDMRRLMTEGIPTGLQHGEINFA